MNGGLDQRNFPAAAAASAALLPPGAAPKPLRNYKLLVDPFLVKNGNKLYRYDGIVAGDAGAAAQYPPVVPRDPRNQLASRMRARLEPHDIPVPRYAAHFISNSFLASLCNFLCPPTGTKSIKTTLVTHRL